MTAVVDGVDTIAAPATPPGRGGIGIIRVSGPGASAIAEAVAGRRPAPRHATTTTFRAADGSALDHGILLYFPGPASFTGEDVVELQGHGGPVVMDRLLARTLELGARLAEPGEFSQRAYLNGRMDLAQAEAVADLIDAGSEAAARAAVHSLEGALSRRARALAEGLLDLRARVEALLDFPDDEIAAELATVAAELGQRRDEVADLQREGVRGRRLTEGATVVLAGPPNAGKSSLMNALARRDSAIVTDLPGTTRDLLRERLAIGGIPVELVDTAGLHAGGDAIEQEGMRRAREALAAADLVLWLRSTADPGAPAVPDELRDAPVVTVQTQADRAGGSTGERPDGSVACSAVTGDGLAALEAVITRLLGGEAAPEGGFTARRRHLEALEAAAAALAAAPDPAEGELELVAAELARAHAALGRITGATGTEDLLGRIFSTFCIGK
ncbi:MAG: tRNA uridine-5-carboxymethylaminomethyl(34) synthesis GTPase MnmE [Pseudomonadota bacterium]